MTQKNGASQTETLPRAGRIGTWEQHHTGIVVADLSAAISFYRDVLGFEIEFEVFGMREQFQRIVGVDHISCDLTQLSNKATGTRIELIEIHGLQPGIESSVPVHVGVAHTAYLVENLHEAVQLVEECGGSLLGEIVEFDEGPAAYLVTPGGSTIELEESN